MSRVPYVSREKLPAPQQQFYDRIAAPRGGRAPKVFELFLNSPEMAARIGDVGAYARFQSLVPGDAREIAVLTTAREMGCQYEFTHHVPLARKEGVREPVIEGIKAGNTRGLLPKESVFIDYARQVLSNRVNDATFQAIEHLLGRKGAVEMTMLVGYYSMIAHVMIALGVELEEGVAPLLPAG